MRSRHKALLRSAIVIEWLFVALAVTFMLTLDEWLPTPLQDWVRYEKYRDVRLSDLYFLTIGPVFLLLSLIGSLGMMFLRKWGGWIYALALPLGLILELLAGPRVEHPIANVSAHIAVFFSGVIVALAFSSKALEKEQGAQQDAPSNGG